jgi:hypothetical protein
LLAGEEPIDAEVLYLDLEHPIEERWWVTVLLHFLAYTPIHPTPLWFIGYGRLHVQHWERK